MPQKNTESSGVSDSVIILASVIPAMFLLLCCLILLLILAIILLGVTRIFGARRRVFDPYDEESRGMVAMGRKGEQKTFTSAKLIQKISNWARFWAKVLMAR